MTVRISFVLSLGRRYLSLGIALVSTMIVARLITPEEMGVFGVGQAIMAIFGIAAGAGVTQYIVQEQELTDTRRRSAFGVLLASAWGSAACLWLLRNPIGAFYHEPAVAGVLAVLAASLLVMPLNTPVMGVLQRDMRFDLLLVVGTVGALAAAGTAIVLAALGYGGHSLAWAMFAEQVGMTAVVAVLRPRALWQPPSLAEWRRVVGIGRSVAGGGLLQQLGVAAPQLALGRMAGLDAAGLYNRGSAFQQLFRRAFMQGIKPVVLPAFARAHRERKDVAAHYVRCVSCLAVLCWPFFVAIAIMAHAVVHALYGDQWFGAVQVVRVLVLAAVAIPVTAIDSDIYIAIGRSELFLRLQLLVQAVRLAAVVATAAVGLEAVAAAVALSAWLQAGVSLAWLHGLLGLSPRALLRALLSTVAVTALSALGPAMAVLAFGPTPTRYLAALGIASLGAAAGWLAGVALIGHPVRDELAWAVDRLSLLARPRGGTAREAN